MSYDYIIAGTGAAGLSLAMHMIGNGQFAGKKILLLDREEKTKNDRTWCFWEKEAGLFEPVVHRRWHQLWIHGQSSSRRLDIRPYEYKLVRGIDFYDYCFRHIRQHAQFDIRFGEIEGMVSNESGTYVLLNGEKIHAGYIFNSILFEKPELKSNEHTLLQHFRGWIIESDQPAFMPEEATLMDFRVPQPGGTAFVYVMPFSASQALVEYTLFSKDLLDIPVYEKQLEEYIQGVLNLSRYRVLEKEFGIIPMTSYRFPVQQGNIIYIGTAGGQTKASSGYTFRFIQKHAAAITRRLAAGKSPVVKLAGKRFRFYDNVLLDILCRGQLPGDRIFTTLFSNNQPKSVLRFLDNESSFAEEIKIIASLPAGPFIRAAINQL